MLLQRNLEAAEHRVSTVHTLCLTVHSTQYTVHSIRLAVLQPMQHQSGTERGQNNQPLYPQPQIIRQNGLLLPRHRAAGNRHQLSSGYYHHGRGVCRAQQHSAQYCEVLSLCWNTERRAGEQRQTAPHCASLPLPEPVTVNKCAFFLLLSGCWTWGVHLELHVMPCRGWLPICEEQGRRTTSRGPSQHCAQNDV